jgi:molybdenum cofactor cytidylyltransferase
MIAAIILAAGQSRRMGTQKLLLPIQGQPMIAHITDQVLRSAVEHTIIVISADSRIPAALAGRNVHFTVNPDPTGDMLSSIRCGLRALPADCDAVLLVLGDQPGISPEIINPLIAAFGQTLHTIVVPTFSGQRGHPLLFSICHREEILARFDDEGLRGLLRAHADQLREFPLPHAEILTDIDRPEDYERHGRRGQ